MWRYPRLFFPLMHALYQSTQPGHLQKIHKTAEYYVQTCHKLSPKKQNRQPLNQSEITVETTTVDALNPLTDAFGEERDSSQTDGGEESQRWRELEDSHVSTCTAGGKMSLLMDPSSLRHLKQPRPTKGIKYGIIIIILQLSIIPSPYFHPLSLSTQMQTLTLQINLSMHAWKFPWNRYEGTQWRHVWAKAQKK